MSPSLPEAIQPKMCVIDSKFSNAKLRSTDTKKKKGYISDTDTSRTRLHACLGSVQ